MIERIKARAIHLITVLELHKNEGRGSDQSQLAEHIIITKNSPKCVMVGIMLRWNKCILSYLDVFYKEGLSCNQSRIMDSKLDHVRSIWAEVKPNSSYSPGQAMRIVKHKPLCQE